MGFLPQLSPAPAGAEERGSAGKAGGSCRCWLCPTRIFKEKPRTNTINSELLSISCRRELEGGRKKELPFVSPLPRILHNNSYQKYSMYVKLFLCVVGTMLSTLSALTHLILTTTHPGNNPIYKIKSEAQGS